MDTRSTPNSSAYSTDAVGISRTLRLPSVTALGLLFTAGLGVYVLTGKILSFAGWQSVPSGYFLLMVIAIPIALTYAERASMAPDGDGIYSLVRAERILWHSYTTGWVLIAGYMALLALFGWGIGIYVDVVLRLGFEVSVPRSILSTVAIVLVGLSSLFGLHISWRSRAFTVYASVIIVASLSVLGLWSGEKAAIANSFRTSTDGTIQVAVLLACSLWGLNFVVGSRRQIVSPKPTLLRGMLTSVLVGGLLGILAAVVAILFRGGISNQLTPLIDIDVSLGILPDGILNLLYAAVGISVCIIGLHFVFARTRRLAEALLRDGFLPRRLEMSNQWLTFSLLFFMVGSALLVFFLDENTLIALASATFFWTAALVHLPDILYGRNDSSETGWPHLPFYPLFPALTVAIGVLMPAQLIGSYWRLILPWMAIGVVYYLFYGRRHSMEVRRDDIVVGEEQPTDRGERADWQVMIAVGDPATAANLIRTGVCLAHAHGGEALVLRTLTLPEQMPVQQRQEVARQNWEELSALVSQTDSEGIRIRPLVRLAPNPTTGIVEAVREERANLLLLGWEAEESDDPFQRKSILSNIIRRVSAEVVVAHGELSERLQRVVVPTAGGANSVVGARLAANLVDETDGEVLILHVLEDEPTPDLEADAQDYLETTRASIVSDAISVSQHVVRAASAKEGILAEATGADLLILGSSRDRAIDMSTFGGLPQEITLASPTPTLVVKSRDDFRYPFLRQGWARLYDALPNLTSDRRDAVLDIMRAAAVPTVDFYVLIILAATIASLGLLQNSAAVIIGAMLVAPLMSPILAIGMSMVQGDLRMLRVAAEATIKGAALAILVGVVTTLISPLDEATNEILARTEPNILDLMVALASGAAAGYAICRKEVAAALPGVAIAAALVPPLCVVGYGFGTSDLDIATGSLLLFVTNLIAIVLAAAIVFLALGFFPERRERGELARGLRISLVSLVVVAIVLGIATFGTVRQVNQLEEVTEIFNSGVLARAARVTELDISRTPNGHTIVATILNLNTEQLTPEDFVELEAELTEAIGGDIVIDATIIQAQKSDLEGADKITLANQTLTEMVGEYMAEVKDIATEYQTYRLTMNADVLASEASTLDDQALGTIQREISEAVDMPVDLIVTIVTGRRTEILVTPTPTSAPAPTPTPTPTPTP